MATNRATTSVINRKCGDCTACCEGWQSANIDGHEMFPGRPCHFFGTTCTIYEFRPQTCKSYFCSWMLDDKKVFPEWFRPDLSGVILTHRDWEGGTYLEVRETGKEITPSVLSWIYEYGARNNMYLRVQVKGTWHSHGDQRFAESFPTTDR